LTLPNLIREEHGSLVISPPSVVGWLQNVCRVSYLKAELPKRKPIFMLGFWWTMLYNLWSFVGQMGMGSVGWMLLLKVRLMLGMMVRVISRNVTLEA
jgi:hypothetical protein